jgi:hypothetical protein
MQAMRHSAKALAWLLLGAMLGVPLAAQALSFASTPAQPPAGCHEHRQSAPPAPVSYKCCQAAHRSAVLQSQHMEELSVLAVRRASEFGVVVTSAPFESLHDLDALPTGSPGIAPLRI